MTRPVLALAVLSLCGLPLPAAGQWAPPGVDLTRPRILLRPGDVPTVQAKLDVQPTPVWVATVMDDLVGRIALADTSPSDPIADMRFKARAAKSLAFLYAVDRTWDGSAVVPFASPAERQAAGDRARDLLLGMYTRSRLAVPPPEGNWDRDISSSEELLQWATVYDTLKGAGYDFGADESVVVENIADLASELYENYVHPATALNFATFHQNNHRSKVGASLVVAGIALAEYAPPPGSDPANLRDPGVWVDYGLDQMDLITRHVLVTGDGAYGEGPFYWRFSAENLLTFGRAWERLLGGADYVTGSGLVIPSPWSHPVYRRSQRWMLDMSFGDGALVHIDDGNPGRTYAFGAAPLDGPDAAAFAWRWANSPRPFDTDGNIDLAPDALVNFEPDLAAAPPAGSPTAFYLEGGHAVLKSDWSPEAVISVVTGEYDTASLFGRDRDGLGVRPQSHEQPEPGAFLLHAFGERLALDPGYISFGQRERVGLPEHHNIVLVDGAGPVSYLNATLNWVDAAARPPADGHARLTEPVDTEFLDAVRVTASYGLGYARYAEAPLLERRVVFPGHRYLVVADRVESRDGAPHAWTWLLHGNGGGTSDGTFEATPAGGRWTRAAARLDSGIALDTGAPLLDTVLNEHEERGKVVREHVTLRARATSEATRSLQLVYPSRTSDAPPAIAAASIPGAAALRLDDGERRVRAWHREADPAVVVWPAEPGLPEAASDGGLALFEARADGVLRMAWAEDARSLSWNGVTLLSSASPGVLGVALEDDRAALVADTGGPGVTVGGLPFVPAAADGACDFEPDDAAGTVHVALGRERRFALRETPGNARPAADPGPDRRVAAGSLVELDGTASCDADGGDLTPRWTLVSAPAPGPQRLLDPGSWHPRLEAALPGPHRVRLVVTDDEGAESLPVELTVWAGPECADGVDGDLDGLIDADDPECALSGGSRESFAAACGLGFELAPLLVLAMAARRRRCLSRHSP